MAASINRVVSERFLLKFGFWKHLLRGSSIIPNFVLSKSAFCSDSSSSDDSDDDKEVKKKLPAKEASPKQHQISDKLSALLSEFKIETSIPPEKSTITLKLAKPLHRRKNKNQLKQESKQPEDERFQTIAPNLTKAVKDVANSLGGDVKSTESELLLRLRSHTNENKETVDTSKNISNVVVGMKIDKSKPKSMIDQRNNRIYGDEDQNHAQSSLRRVGIYNSRRLGIFDLEGEGLKKDAPDTTLWNGLKEHELKLLVSHPPKNAFEEMIRWTEEGKLWKFPIDNEQGLEEEKKVGFHEHVFLEPLLGDFPKKGPIRHFMELVIVGLSKNPYMPVERKKEHVEWYRQYFKDKESILREVDESILQ